MKAIKPPPVVKSRRRRRSQRGRLQRRRLLIGSVIVLTVGAAAWGVYQYIASAPIRAEKAFQDGMRLTGAGDFKGAEKRFTEAVRISPAMAEGYLQRGLARKSMHQMDAAIHDFEHAINEDSDLGPAHTALGEIYRERGDLTRAMSEFTTAINLKPNSNAFYQRGEVYESLGRHEQAIEDYVAAIHEQPDAPYVYRARAMSREAMGDREGAEEDRRTAIRIEHQY